MQLNGLLTVAVNKINLNDPIHGPVPMGGLAQIGTGEGVKRGLGYVVNAEKIWSQFGGGSTTQVMDRTTITKGRLANGESIKMGDGR